LRFLQQVGEDDFHSRKLGNCCIVTRLGTYDVLYSVGCSVGSEALILAVHLGEDDFHSFGMDSLHNLK